MSRNLNDDLNRFYGDPNKWPDSASHDVDPHSVWRSPAKSGVKSKYDVGLGHSCHTTHPALIIPGTDLKIWGGSCHHPIVKDADIYIGFDRGMHIGPRAWPWKDGEEFLFEIQDMGVPKHPAEFVKLVDWTAAQLKAGKKVHCGCIGGHGRTGMFLSALVCTMADMPDAITYVRKNYCQKVVETVEQMRFLSDTFGILPIQGSKQNVKFTTKPKLTPDLFNPAKAVGIIGDVGETIPAIRGYSIWD